MSEFTRIHQRFEYHLEDLHCCDCLHTKQKSSFATNGCGSKTCRFEDIRRDCEEYGRISRPRGWFRNAGG